MQGKKKKITEITYNKTETKHNNKKSRRRPKSKSDFFIIIFNNETGSICTSACASRKKIAILSFGTTARVFFPSERYRTAVPAYCLHEVAVYVPFQT